MSSAENITYMPFEFQGPRVPDEVALFFASILLIAVSTPLTQLSNTFSYMIIGVVYIASLIYATSKIRIIPIDRMYLFLLLIFSIIVLLSGIFSLSVASIIRICAFFAFTTSNMIIIPRLISFKIIMFFTSRYAASLAIIGFLPYFGIDNILGVVDISLWGAQMYWNSTLQPITSIFVNPNGLGFVLVTGTIASIIEANRTHSQSSILLIGINIFGLAFTNYRTGFAALIVMLSLYLVYVVIGRDAYIFAIISGLSTFLVLLLMVLNVIPGPNWLSNLSLNGRKLLWSNTVEAIMQQPIIGFGFGNYTEVVENPHNSYLRIFLSLGVFGGVTYLLIVLKTILTSAREVSDWITLGISLYLTGFFFIQMMNSLTFIGVSFHSTFISLIMGYHICYHSMLLPQTDQGKSKL